MTIYVLISKLYVLVVGNNPYIIGCQELWVNYCNTWLFNIVISCWELNYWLVVSEV